MRNYSLNIAGYNLRFESTNPGPDIMPSGRFLRNLISRGPSGKETLTDNELLIYVHSGRKVIPSDAKCIFHAPFIEEVNGKHVQRISNFWSVWKLHSELFIKTVLPLSDSEKNAVLKFSLNSPVWDLWIEGKDNITDPMEYPLDGLILYYLTVIHADIFIHSSGINYNGKGYLFSGVSGKGKTTMAGLWENAGGKVIHDDRLILRKSETGYNMHNTPVYDNDEPLESPLNEIFIIEHGTDNRITTALGANAISLIMANCIQHNWDHDIIERLLSSVSDLCNKIPVSVLTFKPDRSIIDHILKDE